MRIHIIQIQREGVGGRVGGGGGGGRESERERNDEGSEKGREKGREGGGGGEREREREQEMGACERMPVRRVKAADRGKREDVMKRVSLT